MVTDIQTKQILREINCLAIIVLCYNCAAILRRKLYMLKLCE